MELNYNPFELAGRADCGMPDTATSEGAAWLLSIQDTVNETALTDTDYVLPAAQLIMRGHRGDSGGFDSDVQMWRAFVDLAGWTEVEKPMVPEEIAYEALGRIAYRLAQRLILERRRVELDGMTLEQASESLSR